jgi:hypothetical protein
MLTLEEVKQELGIDFNDHDERLKRYIKLAKEWLDGAVDSYQENDERAKQLVLFVVEDLYERSSSIVKENNTISKLKNDFIMQLKYEDNNGNVQSTNNDSKN